MNFRIYASGMLLILIYQLGIAAAVIWLAVHCEAASGAEWPDREAAATAAGALR